MVSDVINDLSPCLVTDRQVSNKDTQSKDQSSATSPLKQQSSETVPRLLSAPQSNAIAKIEQEQTRKVVVELCEVMAEKPEVVHVEGWVDKKTKSFPYNFHKRWVEVEDTYMLWGRFKIHCKNVHDPKQRNNFKHINLLQVAEIKSDERDDRKFSISTGISGKQQDRKITIWRCENDLERDFWVNSLRLHVVRAKDKVLYLRSKRQKQRERKQSKV